MKIDCELIFYTAMKTSLCERSLKKRFSELDLSLKRTSLASSSQELGESLKTALADCSCVFVIANLSIDGERNAKEIMSKGLAESDLDDYKKLRNEDGEDGFVFKAGKQMIAILPDNPEQIDNLMNGPLSDSIKKLGM